MASRNLNDLQPAFRKLAQKLLDRSRKEGLDLLIYCTLRSVEEQAELFCQSRTQQQIEVKAEELISQWHRPDLAQILLDVGPGSGKVITNAGPGQSMHNYGLAFDGVPLRNGKAVWQAESPEELALWQHYGQIGTALGLEWAGNWSLFREFPHMQEPGERWKKLI